MPQRGESIDTLNNAVDELRKQVAELQRKIVADEAKFDAAIAGIRALLSAHTKGYNQMFTTKAAFDKIPDDYGMVFYAPVNK